MKNRRRERGIITIALTFAVVLSLVAAAVIKAFYARAPFAASQLKRIKAIPYLEAALYETFNRFRIGGPPGWDINSWAGNKTLTIDGVDVTISVVSETIAATGKTKKKVTATTNYNEISL